MKILLAEDEAQVREELTELLTEEHYKVVQAADGIEAFEKFRADTDIELLLLDIRMPRCTGIQALEAIRKAEVNGDRIFEVIFITGNNDAESVVRALKLDAFSFLFKPIVVETLLEELGSARDNINIRRYRRFQRETLESQVATNTKQITQLTEELRIGMGSAVELLALAAEHYIPGVELHLNRIGEMSACLGARLDLDASECQILRLASMLHDVGKLKGPVSLYNAERELTPEEFEQTKQHTVIGANLLKRSEDPVMRLGQVICAQHHENDDGSGYPYGLTGQDIAIEAAIVHAVDVYDNLRAPHPYRGALPHYQALDVIINGDSRSSSDHFNPRVLQVMLSRHRDIEAIYERYRPITS